MPISSFRRKVVAVSESEHSGLKADLSRHLAHPNTLVVSNLYFQAWGRKPG